jgi:hypothetical protein
MSNSAVLVSPGVFGVVILTWLGLSLAHAGSDEVQHPVFDPGDIEGQRASLAGRLAPLLEMSDDELAALVPERNGFRFCDCPNCEMGAQQGQLTWMGLEAPDQVKCRFCGMVFPNEKYPEDKTITALNPRGETVTYHYYENENGRHYFSGRARYDAKHRLGRNAYELAKLAYISKDPAHERKAIMLLDAFAQKYTGWCVVFDLTRGDSKPLDSHPEKPHPYWGGIWNRWHYGDVPTDLIRAYDLVYSSEQWDKLSAEKGLDRRQRLEDEMFRASVVFLKGYKEHLSNMSPTLYRGFIIAGRVLAEPDYVHDALDRFSQLLRTQFLFDGMWKEGTISYHRQTIGGLRAIMNLAEGYSDPEGYTWPQDGSHFEDLDLAAQFPFVTKVMQADSALVFPNGRGVPGHDPWARSSYRPELPPQTALLPAMEHCCLHRGEGASQMQARLHFSPGYGHKHADDLSLIVWAKGRELLSDLGYTHTAYRRWSVSTPAHNGVVVDEANQQSSRDRCDLLLFDSGAGPVQTVEATATACYPDLTAVYRRQVMLVDVSPTQAYVVDLFRVAGGSQHDWFLHGSADYDQTATTSLDLKPVAGTLLGPDAEFRLPTSEGDAGDAGDRNLAYAFIHDLAQAQTDDRWSITFRPGTVAGGALATNANEASDAQIRTTVLGQQGTTVVLGRAPSIRRAKEDDSKLADFLMPLVVARRSGEDLASTFVAMHEPFGDEPFITQVRALTPLEGASPTVALEIIRQAERDIIICCTQEAATEAVVIPGDPAIEFSGRTAFLRLRADELITAYMLDGTLLRCGDFTMTTDPAPEGAIEGVVREGNRFAFRVAERLPPGKALAGRTVLVTHPDGSTHGYVATGAEPTQGGSLILLADNPGFAIHEDGKTEFLYFPQGELEGSNTYRVLTVTCLQRRP